MMKDRSILLIVIAAFVAFALILGVRASEFLEGPSQDKETSYVTLAFKNVNGKVNVEGLIGVKGTNPTVVMRSAVAHQMILRIVNHDTVQHQFTIDGLGVSTKILDPEGINYGVLTLSGGVEGTYTYRDALSPDMSMGEFKIVRVTAFG